MYFIDQLASEAYDRLGQAGQEGITADAVKGQEVFDKSGDYNWQEHAGLEAETTKIYKEIIDASENLKNNMLKCLELKKIYEKIMEDNLCCKK